MLPAKLKTRVQFPEPTWCKGRANSRELSSDLNTVNVKRLLKNSRKKRIDGREGKELEWEER